VTDEDEAHRLAVLGAAAIYLDLLNLLLHLIQILASIAFLDD
jgi:FtsH-binding integral membrane protein